MPLQISRQEFAVHGEGRESVDTAHCENTTDLHLATVVVERVQLNDCHELLLTFLIEPARVGPR